MGEGKALQASQFAVRPRARAVRMAGAVGARGRDAGRDARVVPGEIGAFLRGCPCEVVVGCVVGNPGQDGPHGSVF